MAACGTRAACATRNGFGFARNTATTFDVFFWLQVTKFDVSLLHSAPNGAGHIDIEIIFILHTCRPQRPFTKKYALGQDNFCPRSHTGAAMHCSRSTDAVIRLYDDF